MPSTSRGHNVRAPINATTPQPQPQNGTSRGTASRNPPPSKSGANMRGLPMTPSPKRTDGGEGTHSLRIISQATYDRDEIPYRSQSPLRYQDFKVRLRRETADRTIEYEEVWSNGRPIPEDWIDPYSSDESNEPDFRPLGLFNKKK